jgi:DNA invertase Pin-like site-specific DNA recombinase
MAAPGRALGVFAEFERAMIQERVRAGMARARAEGKQVGRPKIAAEVEQHCGRADGSSRRRRRMAWGSVPCSG